MQKKSKAVKIIYVNRKIKKVLFLPVKTGCGKACGKCGKLSVFNSLIPVLHSSAPVGGGEKPPEKL